MPRLLSLLLVITLLVCAPFARAASGDAKGEAVSRFSSQPGSKAPSPQIKSQPESEHTLEIAPQPGAMSPEPSVREIPSDKGFKPEESTASLEKKFSPLESKPAGKPKLPYLGVSVEYTLKCYAGQEEHGLEIINIDPDSPAAKAGLQGKGRMTALGAAGVTAGALLGPLELAVVPLLHRAGQLGQDGDLIVAVDDRRVRSELDLEDELAKLKPGDTMYLTVIRALPSGGHKTMKIAVKVDDPSKLASKSSTVSPSGTEQYAY